MPYRVYGTHQGPATVSPHTPTWGEGRGGQQGRAHLHINYAGQGTPGTTAHIDYDNDDNKNKTMYCTWQLGWQFVYTAATDKEGQKCGAAVCLADYVIATIIPTIWGKRASFVAWDCRFPGQNIRENSVVGE